MASTNDAAIEPAQISYFQERLRNRMHEVILRRFLEQSKSDGLTKAVLARRLGKRPEQITRWLAAPGNITIETISDLLLAMNSELDVHATDWSKRPRSNEAHELVFKANSLGSYEVGTTVDPKQRTVDQVQTARTALNQSRNTENESSHNAAREHNRRSARSAISNLTAGAAASAARGNRSNAGAL